MQRSRMWSVSIVVMIWSANAVADSPKLKGDYAFTGSAACIDTVSPNNFNPDFTPTGGSSSTFGQSFAAEGIRTFNGDGTGTVTGSTMGITFPAANEGAGSDNFQFSFTYTVNSDGSWTSAVVGLVTGTVLTGGRAGQTFTVSNFPTVTGMISKNGNTLTSATLTPTVETVSYSNGDVHNRICHRSRILTKIKD